MKTFGELLWIAIADYLLWLFILGYGALCFFVFDYFHITNTDQQLEVGVALAILPFAVGGIFLARSAKRREEEERKKMLPRDDFKR